MIFTTADAVALYAAHISGVESFAELLRRLRTRAGMSYSILAGRIGVHPDTIANAESGRTKSFKPGAMLKLAEVFGDPIREWMVENAGLIVEASPRESRRDAAATAPTHRDDRGGLSHSAALDLVHKKRDLRKAAETLAKFAQESKNADAIKAADVVMKIVRDEEEPPAKPKRGAK